MKILFIVLVLLLGFNYGCTEGKKNESSEDLVILSPAKVDLGRITDENIVKLTFDIVNNSNKEARIVSQAKSCGCTNFVLPSKILKSKSRTTVKVDFDPKQVSGNFEKSVFLRLDNGKILLYKFFGIIAY